MEASACARARQTTVHAQIFELDRRRKYFPILNNYSRFPRRTQVTEVTEARRYFQRPRLNISYPRVGGDRGLLPIPGHWEAYRPQSSCNFRRPPGEEPGRERR